MHDRQTPGQAQAGRQAACRDASPPLLSAISIEHWPCLVLIAAKKLKHGLFLLQSGEAPSTQGVGSILWVPPLLRIGPPSQADPVSDDTHDALGPKMRISVGKWDGEGELQIPLEGLGTVDWGCIVELHAAD
jgi:hypothetical protein